jgi:hypothetical protein
LVSAKARRKPKDNAETQKTRSNAEAGRTRLEGEEVLEELFAGLG